MDDSIIEECEQPLQSKREVIKKKTTSFWASSRGKIFLIWTLAVAIIAAIYILIDKEQEKALEAAFLSSTLVGKYRLFDLMAFLLTI